MNALNYLDQVGKKQGELAERFRAYAGALESAGHHRLARQFAEEADTLKPSEVMIKIPFPGVRACLEDLLNLLQRDVVPLVIVAMQDQAADGRAELEATLACNERQLDWVEAQIYMIQELGEGHYLAGCN